MFSVEDATNSGICSTPTARPSGPTMSAKQAVRYPVPVKFTKDNYSEFRTKVLSIATTKQARSSIITTQKKNDVIDTSIPIEL